MRTFKGFLGMAAVVALSTVVSVAQAGLIINMVYESGADGTKVKATDSTHLTMTSDATGTLTFGLYANVVGTDGSNANDGVAVMGGQILSRNALASAPTTTNNAAWVVNGTMAATVNSALFGNAASQNGNAVRDMDGDGDLDIGGGSNATAPDYFCASNGSTLNFMSAGTAGLGVRLGTVTFAIGAVNANAVAGAETIIDFWPVNGTGSAHGAYGEFSNITTSATTWTMDGAAKGLFTKSTFPPTTSGVVITLAGGAPPTTTTPSLNLSAVVTTAPRIVAGSGKSATVATTITNPSGGVTTTDSLAWTATAGTGSPAPGSADAAFIVDTASGTVAKDAAGATITGTFTPGAAYAKGSQLLSLKVDGKWASDGTKSSNPASAFVSGTAYVLANRTLSVDNVGTGQRIMVGSTLASNIRSNGGVADDNFHATAVNLGAGTVAANGDGVSVNAATAKAFNDLGLSAPVTATFGSAGAKSGSISVKSLLSDGEAASAGATVQDALLNYNVVAVSKRAFDPIAAVNIAGSYLKGATVSGNATVTSQSGQFVTQPTVNGAAVTSGSVSLPVSLVLSAYGANGATKTFTVTPEGLSGEGTYSDLSVQVSANAGQAIAKITPNGVSGKNAVFDAANLMVANVGTSYGPLSSIVQGDLGTEAKITGLVATPGQVSMNWRTRAVDETPVADPAMFKDRVLGLITDVVDVQRQGSNAYLLEMKYDPNLLSGGASTEGVQAAHGAIYVAWMNGTQWENAGATRLASLPSDLSTLVVGNWGVDTSTHTAWVMSGNNGQFSVVPEPATWALLLVGGVALVPYFRRRKSA